MATTLRDITSRAPVPATQGEGSSSPTLAGNALPLGTCGTCEHVLFAGFQGADASDETLWKSADRRAEESGERERPRRYKCRHCGRTVDETPPQGAQVTR